MAKVEEGVEDTSSSLIRNLLAEILHSPINLALLSICAILLYKLLSRKKNVDTSPPVPRIPLLKKQDMTLQELKKYDGTDEYGRVCVAVNGKIFDVSKGRRFYGPGGPYEAFAGRDASRGLATFSVAAPKDYDDLSDLNSLQMESVKEWEIQFMEKYHYVGRLLKPGEEPTDYSDEEEASLDLTARESESRRENKKKDI